MPNASPKNNDWDHNDWIRWRATSEADTKYIKHGVDELKETFKEYAEKSEERINGVEIEVAKNKQKTIGEFKMVKTGIKIHWLLIALIISALLGLGVRAAFGMEEASRDTVEFYKDGSIRYDYSVKLIGQDTVSFGPFRVKDYRSFGLYLRVEGADSIDLGAICLQSDIQDSVFARVDGYSVIDTSFSDSAIAHWYAVYPSGLTYITYYVYGNAGNDLGDSCSVRVRLLFSTWKGTLRTYPGTGVYVHHHDAFDKPVDFRDSVTFYALDFPTPSPYKALRWSPYHKMLYPLTDLDVSLGDPSHRYGAVYGRYFYLNATAVLDGTVAGEIRSGADFSPTTDANKNLGRSDGQWDTTFTVHVIADSADIIYGSIDTVYSNLYPITDGTISLGSATRHFGSIYTNQILFGTDRRFSYGTNGIMSQADLYPAVDLADNLGLANNRYDSLFCLNVVADTFPNTIVSKNATAAVSAQPNSYPFNVVGYPTSGIYFEKASGRDGAGLLLDYRRKGSNYPDWRLTGLGTALLGKIRFKGAGTNLVTADVLGRDKGDFTLYDNTGAKYLQWDASNQLLMLTSNQYAWLDARTPSELTIFANNNLRLATDGVTGDITFDNDFVPTTDIAQNIGTAALGVDTIFYDHLVDVGCIFEGTGEEALEILNTLQRDPADSTKPIYDILDPYLHFDERSVQFDKLVYVLAAAVQQLQLEIEKLKSEK